MVGREDGTVISIEWCGLGPEQIDVWIAQANWRCCIMRVYIHSLILQHFMLSVALI
jgi:hypothetical protein